MFTSPYISANTPRPTVSEESLTSSSLAAETAKPSAAKPLLTPDEFREYLGGAIGRNSIYELLRAKRIRHIKIGRKVLIPHSEIEDFPMREAAHTA